MNDPSQKPRRSTKSREVSSRFFLTQAASPSREFTINNGGSSSKNGTHPSSPVSSPSPVSHSPVRGIKPSSAAAAAATAARTKSKSLWPSSAVSSNAKTLADHLGSIGNSKRPKDAAAVLGKCESGRMIQIQKENHRSAAIGGSFRYTGKLGFKGNSKLPSSPSSPPSSSSSTSSSSSSGNLYTNSGFVPGRLSVDENALYKTAPLAADEDSSDVIDPEFERFEPSPSDEKPNRRKLGFEVPSRYLKSITKTIRNPDPKPRPDSIDRSSSLEASPKSTKKKFNIKGAMRRANSLTGPNGGGGGTPSQWALSPGRTGSPPMTVENKERPMSFSTHRGMEKLLSLGFDFFKSSKRISYAPSSTSSLSSSSSSKSLGGNSDSVHQLRMVHCRMLQWRYANARAESVNQRMNKQAESDMVSAWNTIAKMRQSVMRKKLQLQKEQLEMKLASILHSQLRGLESWGGMERQHASALSTTQESLQAVVCRVPLVQGARVNQELASLAFRHATDLTDSITLALTAFSPPSDKTAEMVSELAEVVAQEKLLIQEFHEIYQTVSTLQVQESELKSAIMQLNSSHKLQLQQEVMC
ncbi:QWRF motif-containing protein 3 [Linum grandiflorum]